MKKSNLCCHHYSLMQYTFTDFCHNQLIQIKESDMLFKYELVIRALLENMCQNKFMYVLFSRGRRPREIARCLNSQRHILYTYGLFMREIVQNICLSECGYTTFGNILFQPPQGAKIQPLNCSPVYSVLHLFLQFDFITSLNLANNDMVMQWKQTFAPSPICSLAISERLQPAAIKCHQQPASRRRLPCARFQLRQNYARMQCFQLKQLGLIRKWCCCLNCNHCSQLKVI